MKKITIYSIIICGLYSCAGPLPEIEVPDTPNKSEWADDEPKDNFTTKELLFDIDDSEVDDLIAGQWSSESCNEINVYRSGSRLVFDAVNCESGGILPFFDLAATNDFEINLTIHLINYQSNSVFGQILLADNSEADVHVIELMHSSYLNIFTNYENDGKQFFLDNEYTNTLSLKLVKADDQLEVYEINGTEILVGTIALTQDYAFSKLAFLVMGGSSFEIAEMTLERLE